MKGGVYIIKCLTGDCYVGSTANFKGRRATHFHSLRSGTHYNARMQAAFHLYGESGLLFIPLLICAKADLLLYEQLAMDALSPAYNISKVAGSNRGVKLGPEAIQRLSEAKLNPSPETRAKISAAGIGRVASAETRAKRSASLKGRVFTPEHRAKIAAAATGRISPNKGKTLSDETKAKLSAAASGRKGPPQSNETKARQAIARKAWWDARRKKLA